MIEIEVETGVGVGVASSDEKKFIELLRVCDTTEPLPVEAGKRMLAVPPEVTVTGAVPVKVAETVVGVTLCVTEDRNESAWDIATEAADGITTSVAVIVTASAITTDALDRASHTASCWSDSTMSASATQKITVGRKALTIMAIHPKLAIQASFPSLTNCHPRLMDYKVLAGVTIP